jgi:Mn2+/Fe2+ NRAMP family transporter
MFAVFGGTIANLFVVILSFALLPRLIFTYSKNLHHQFLATHWLGIFNGAFVILFWLIAAFLIETLPWW